MTDPVLGSGTNEFQPFATGVGANVETPTDWAADTIRQQGFQRGIANSTQANTVLRNASFIAAMIAQFSADYSGESMLDDGNVLEAEQVFIDALRRVFRGVFFITDTGTKNAMIGADAGAPTPTAYDTRMLIIVKKMNANNDAAMTANFWDLGAVGLKDNTGADLSTGALIANSYYIVQYDGTNMRVLGGVAQYTSVTNLTANSGDMVEVLAGSGIVNWRTLRGTHDATPNDLDRWPRGEETTDIADYLTSLELIAWLKTKIPTGALLGIQCITDTGTYTKTAGTTKAIVFATGGGGAGGMHICCAGGGGSGSTAIALADLSGTNTVSVTIGAGGVGVQAPTNGSSVGGNGGQTSFGSYAVAGGGQGGQGGDKGGNGGTATTGVMQIRGGDGGTSFAGNYYGAGNGGSSYWGGGGCGADLYGAHTGSGYPGTAFGSGGGGGDSGMGSGRTGGNGAKGVVLVFEFA